MLRNLPDLRHLAVPGAILDLRVTPGASADRVAVAESGLIRVSVTAVPEKGRATASVVKLLAKALGIPASRLSLIRGATSRDKSFQVLP